MLSQTLDTAELASGNSLKMGGHQSGGSALVKQGATCAAFINHLQGQRWDVPGWAVTDC